MVMQNITTGDLIQNSITELSNGWFVAVMEDGRGFVSEGFDGPWELLFTSPNVLGSPLISIESTGTMLHVFRQRNVYSFDVPSYQRGTELSGAYDFFNYISNFESGLVFGFPKTMYSENNELHVIGQVFRTGLVSNDRFDTVYRKATISNGGVNWSSENILRTSISSNRNYIEVVVKNGVPYIFNERQIPNNGMGLEVRIGTSTPEVTHLIYNHQEYRHNNSYEPNVVLDENGNFLVTLIIDDTIYITESADGINWSDLISIQESPGIQESKITVDRYNDVYVFYRTISNALRMKKRTNGVWGSEQATWNNAENISVTYHKQFTSTIVGYAWNDVTSGVAHFNRILVNSPPYEPTLIDKENFDARFEERLEWIFEDGDVQDLQSAYHLQLIRNGDGATLVDTGKVGPTPPNQFIADEFYNLPAGTLDNDETYSWRVKTWDIFDAESPWSDYGTFFTNEKPTVEITSPASGHTNETTSIRVNWIMNDPNNEPQSAYQIKLKNNGNVVFDSGKLNGINTRHYDIPFNLENYQNYTIEATVWDEHDIASDVDSVSFLVNYTTPVKPEIEVTTSSTNASISIRITNPEPTNDEPEVVSNDVYRREGNGQYVRIAKNISPNATYTDYTVASGEEYTYYVRAWGDNDTFDDSTVADTSVEFKNVRLSLAITPNTSVSLVYNPERSFDYGFDSATMQFAGRNKPVAEFGEMRTQDLSLNYLIETHAFESLQDIIFRNETLLYRDSRGRKAYVVATSFNVTDDIKFQHFYNISLPLTEVDYKEGI